jgi:hypothetical protein
MPRTDPTTDESEPATGSPLNSKRKRRHYLIAPWWIKALRGNASQLAVMFALATFVDSETEECFPSIAALCKATGLARSQVLEALRGLYDHTPLKDGVPPACLVHRWREHNSSSVYRLAYDRPFKHALSVQESRTLVPVQESETDKVQEYGTESVQESRTLVGPTAHDNIYTGYLASDLIRRTTTRKRAGKAPKKERRANGDLPSSPASGSSASVGSGAGAAQSKARSDPTGSDYDQLLGLSS